MGEASQRLSEELIIRPMTLADVDGVLAVEQASFFTPWSREAFVAEIEDNDLACYLVIELAGQIAGYVGMWLILDEAHVTNVAVLPVWRGRGLGGILMNTLIASARRRGAHRMTLEVRPSNDAALHLYRKLGFTPCGLRPRYYADTQEDAIIMWLDEL